MMSAVYGRYLRFAVGNYILLADDYEITGDVKKTELAFVNSTVKTISAGARRLRLTVRGKMPCIQRSAFLENFTPLLLNVPVSISIDYMQFSVALLHGFKLKPSNSSSIAEYEMLLELQQVVG